MDDLAAGIMDDLAAGIWRFLVGASIATFLYTCCMPLAVKIQRWRKNNGAYTQVKPELIPGHMLMIWSLVFSFTGALIGLLCAAELLKRYFS